MPPMANITDVSRIKANTTIAASFQSVIGRMLSLANSPDGPLVCAGSYSNCGGRRTAGRRSSRYSGRSRQRTNSVFPDRSAVGASWTPRFAPGWHVDQHPRVPASIAPISWVSAMPVFGPRSAMATAPSSCRLVPKFTGRNQANSWVFSQSPAAGKIVAAGSTITMVLPTGPGPSDRGFATVDPPGCIRSSPCAYEAACSNAIRSRNKEWTCSGCAMPGGTDESRCLTTGSSTL